MLQFKFLGNGHAALRPVSGEEVIRQANRFRLPCNGNFGKTGSTVTSHGGSSLRSSCSSDEKVKQPVAGQLAFCGLMG